MFALGVAGARGCGRGRGLTFSEQGAVCVSITGGGESRASQEHPVCSLRGDQGWVAGGKSTPTACSVKGTLPQLLSLVRGIPHAVLSWAV